MLKKLERNHLFKCSLHFDYIPLPYTIFFGKVFFVFLLFTFQFSYSQVDTTAVVSASTDSSINNVVITNASMMHVTGDAFIFANGKVISKRSKIKVPKNKSSEIKSTKLITKQEKAKEDSQKNYAQKSKPILWKYHSGEDSSRLFTSKSVIVKCALYPNHDLLSAVKLTAISFL